MRFLLDESADLRLADYLLRFGHDVTSVVRDYQLAMKDRDVLATAAAEDRVLITNDRDFGELIFRHGLDHAGVILFRLESADLATKLMWLQRLLDDHAENLREFLVVTERDIRVRHTRAR
ncbi:MAG TPA: DUF5615 family PIN-like protein [Tepidiformaceae bacterium]